MLTKDLLHIKVKAKRFLPVFIAAGDGAALAAARNVADAFSAAAGVTEEVLRAGIISDHPLVPAFVKLMLDRCEFDEANADTAARRWRLIKSAQDLRLRERFPTLTAFQAEFSVKNAFRFGNREDDLYSDLPDLRKIKAVRPMNADDLVHRYNCALIQGALIHAQHVEIDIDEADLPMRRFFFSQLKFARLMAEALPANKKSKNISIAISGPLAVFQNVQSYGLRLANFFPFVLLLPKWRLRASVKWKNKILDLKVDDSLGIRSHYRERKGYVPEEFSQFLAAFNDKGWAWEAAYGEDMLQLGGQSYCLPDFTFSRSDGKVAHLELFHKWHLGQLQKRLHNLETTPKNDLIIGIDKNLLRTTAIQELFAKPATSAIKMLEFQTLPTPKAVFSLLESL